MKTSLSSLALTATSIAYAAALLVLGRPSDRLPGIIRYLLIHDIGDVVSDMDGVEGTETAATADLRRRSGGDWREARLLIADFVGLSPSEQALKLIESLGLTNVFADAGMNGEGTGGPVEYETALERIKDDTTLFIVTYGDAARTQFAGDDRYASLSPFTDDRVWLVLGPQTVDYHCDALLHFRPDIELKDYAIALAPDQFPGEKPMCFEPLGN